MQIIISIMIFFFEVFAQFENLAHAAGWMLVSGINRQFYVKLKPGLDTPYIEEAYLPNGDMKTFIQ